MIRRYFRRYSKRRRLFGVGVIPPAGTVPKEYFPKTGQSHQKTKPAFPAERPAPKTSPKLTTPKGSPLGGGLKTYSAGGGRASRGGTTTRRPVPLKNAYEIVPRPPKKKNKGGLKGRPASRGKSKDKEEVKLYPKKKPTVSNDKTYTATSSQQLDKNSDMKTTTLDSPVKTGVDGVPVPTPVTETEHKKKKSRPGSIELHPGYFYRRHVKMGRYYSKALKMLIKIHGTQTRESNNTKRVSTFLADRDYQHLDYGFQQKLIVTLPIGDNSTLEDLIQKLNTGTVATPSSPTDHKGTSTEYAAVLKRQRVYEFHNSNTYHRMNVKLSICGVKNPHYTMNDFLDNILHTSAQITADAQITEGLPIYQQISGVFKTQATSSSMMSKTLVSPGASIFNLSPFKNNFFVAKTVRKVLHPNDTFEFILDNYHRSGLNLSEADARREKIATTAPVPYDYFVVAELYGVPCEGIHRSSASETSPRLGTSPGWGFFEFKESITFIRKDTNLSNLSADINAEVPVLIRSFRKSVKESVRLFNVNVSDITNDSATTTVGSMYIPIVSDQLQTAEYPKAARKPD